MLYQYHTGRRLWFYKLLANRYHIQSHGCLALTGPYPVRFSVSLKEEEASNKDTVLRRRRRLYAKQDSSASIESDNAGSGDEWKPPPASLPSTGEVDHETLTPTIPSSVPSGNLNAATCLSILAKVPDPISLRATNVLVLSLPIPTGTQVAGTTSVEPTNHLGSDCNLFMRGRTCEFCGKAFAKSKLLNRHVNGVHKELGRVKCDICSKNYANRQTLKNHIDGVHNNLRNFPCEFCGHCFNRADGLKRHVESVHEKMRRWTCEFCTKCFSEKKHLNDHIDSVHKGLREFKCETCGAWFTRKSILNSHIDSVHKSAFPPNMRNYACNICGHSFYHNGHLKRHINTVHRNRKQEKPENPS